MANFIPDYSSLVFAHPASDGNCPGCVEDCNHCAIHKASDEITESQLDCVANQEPFGNCIVCKCGTQDQQDGKFMCIDCQYETYLEDQSKG